MPRIGLLEVLVTVKTVVAFPSALALMTSVAVVIAKMLAIVFPLKKFVRDIPLKSGQVFRQFLDEDIVYQTLGLKLPARAPL
jgi:hypothetical protein